MNNVNIFELNNKKYYDKITLAVKGKFPNNWVGRIDGANFVLETQLRGNEVLIRKDEDKFKEERF